MKISVGDGLTAFTPIDFSSFTELSNIICETSWAPGLFHENYRSKARWIGSTIVALDYDEGLGVERALELFKDYIHIIATTKSHQKEKNGKVCDRFRVVLKLETICDDISNYEATVINLLNEFGGDIQCKDASRFFYACDNVISVSESGICIPIKESSNFIKPKREFTEEQRGRLSRSTMEFLLFGAPDGEWNSKCFKAAIDWNEQGYDQSDFEEYVEQKDGYLDFKAKATIKSAFSRVPKYEPRTVEENKLVVRSSELSSSLINYLTDKDVVKGQPTYIDMLDALLIGKRPGEVTALCAEGKTGKNALWHYMQWLWLKNNVKFAYASRELDIDTEVLPDYLSMELEKNIRLEPVSESFYREKLKEWDIPFAVGRGFFPIDILERWIAELREEGVTNFFFDHLHWMCEDPEDYKEASKLSRMLKMAAKKYNCHIDVIIQPKVLMDGQKPSLNSMKGGSAIGQNIDNFLTLERVYGQKNISKLSLKAKRSRLGDLGELYLIYDSNTLKFDATFPEEKKEGEIVLSPPPLKLANRFSE